MSSEMRRSDLWIISLQKNKNKKNSGTKYTYIIQIGKIKNSSKRDIFRLVSSYLCIYG